MGLEPLTFRFRGYEDVTSSPPLPNFGIAQIETKMCKLNLDVNGEPSESVDIDDYYHLQCLDEEEWVESDVPVQQEEPVGAYGATRILKNARI